MSKLNDLIADIDLDAALAEVDALDTPAPTSKPKRKKAAGKKKTAAKKAAGKRKAKAPAKKRTAKRKKAAPKGNTGPVCADEACNERIPGLGQDGYHHKRIYCAQGTPCNERRTAAKEAAKQQYLADKAAGVITRKPKATQEQIAEAVAEAEAADLLGGPKLKRNGSPSTCRHCAGFIPRLRTNADGEVEENPYEAYCGQEHKRAYKLAKSGQGIHPVAQGDGERSEKPERKRKGKARQKIDNVQVRQQESSGVRSSVLTADEAETLRLLKASDDPRAPRAIELLKQRVAQRLIDAV